MSFMFYSLSHLPALPEFACYLNIFKWRNITYFYVSTNVCLGKLPNSDEGVFSETSDCIVTVFQHYKKNLVLILSFNVSATEPKHFY